MKLKFDFLTLLLKQRKQRMVSITCSVVFKHTSGRKDEEYILDNINLTESTENIYYQIFEKLDMEAIVESEYVCIIDPMIKLDVSFDFDEVKMNFLNGTY